MIRHLDVDVVGRNRLFTCPAFLDNARQFVRYVHAPAVIPTGFKPIRQFLAGIVVEHVHVQFPLLQKPRERQVATAEIANRRVNRVGTKKQVELRVQRVLKEQLDDDFLRFNLGSQSAQTGFVFVSGNTDSQLVAEFFR